MRGFDLSDNYNSNPEALIRHTRAKLKKVPNEALSGNNNLRKRLTTIFDAMANKTLREYSAPTTDNIRVGPAVDVGEDGF